MENPFYVEPANPLKGIMALTSGIGEKLKFDKKKAVREQMKDAVKSGNTDSLADIAMENPWITEELDKFYKFKNESTKANAIETARNILLGGSPSQHLIDRADMVLAEGGDPSGTIALAEKAQADPEEAKKEAERVLALYAPKEYLALKASQKVDEPKQQIVDGQLVTIMPGGSASASPIEGLQALTKPTSDYERWKQNPEEFAQFRAAGRDRGDGGGRDKAPAGYRFTADGQLAFIPGGPADPATKSVRDQPTKALPASAVESLVDMHNVAKALKEANDLATKSKVETGPVVGRMQAIGAKFGLASDSFVDMDQRLNTASNIMLKLRSGAAVTESEYQRFLKEFPQKTDKKEVRERKTKNVINYMNELISEKVDAFAESGYKTPQIVPVQTAPDGTMPLPPEAVSRLQAGKVTAFKNGQKWTLGANGQPQRVQ